MRDSNYYPDGNTGRRYEGGLSQNVNDEALAHKIVQKLNANLPVAQMKRAVDKFNANMMPAIYSVTATHTATSAVQTFTRNIDATFAFFCTGFTAIIITATADVDYYLTGIQLASGTNLIVGRFAYPCIIRFVGFPLELPWYIPANDQINVTTQNGSTTAASTYDFIFFGVKAPANYVAQVQAGKIR